MRPSEDEGIIHNSLTEIALFLLFTFGVLIVASGDQSLGSDQPRKLADLFISKDLTLPLPFPFEPSPSPKSKPSQKGAQSRPTISDDEARLRRIDAQILTLRAKGGQSDKNPCFLWMSEGNQGDIVINGSTIGQSGPRNTKQFVVHPLRAVSALGIFVTSRVSSTKLFFQAQERLGSIRANYYPTGPVRAGGLVAARTSAEYKIVNEFNQILRQISPTNDINNILLPIVKFMASHKLDCGIHVDLHGMIFDNEGKSGGISSNLLIEDASQLSSEGEVAKIQRRQSCHSISQGAFATSGFYRHSLDGNDNIKVEKDGHVLEKVPMNQLREYCQNQRGLTKGKASIDFSAAVTVNGSSGAFRRRLYWNSLNPALNSLR
jgi:hypothetical protein